MGKKLANRVFNSALIKAPFRRRHYASVRGFGRLGAKGSGTNQFPNALSIGSNSWVNVAQEQRSLKKYDVEVLKNDGVDSVVVPDEVFQDPSPLWEDFLIGKHLMWGRYMP